MDISRTAEYLIACYIVLMRPKKVETAVYGCNCFSLDSIMSLAAPLKGLGHAILGNFSSDQMVIELTKI